MDQILPPSLKQTQNDITKALVNANIKINFNITNYQEETSDVEYSLTSTQLPLECTVTQAKEIADAYLKKWKTTPHKHY